ncbi:MAG: tetratricopeptide repeat protein [Acidimicrobiales bacterium]
MRVLDDTLRVYGPDHPATLLAKHNLANSHADLGRHDAALSLREQVLGAREQTLGVEHLQTVSARSNLANSLAALGRVEEALSLRELVADVRLRTLGLDSPDHGSAQQPGQQLRRRAATRTRCGCANRCSTAASGRSAPITPTRSPPATTWPTASPPPGGWRPPGRPGAHAGRLRAGAGPRPPTRSPHGPTWRSAPAGPGVANGNAGPPPGGATGNGAAANGTYPTAHAAGHAAAGGGRCRGPARRVPYGAQSGPMAPAPAEPTRKKRRFWFFGRR